MPINVIRQLPWIRRVARKWLLHYLVDQIEANAGDKKATLEATRELRELLKQKDTP